MTGDLYYPLNHPEKDKRGQLITDVAHYMAASSQDELKFKSEEEIREMCVDAGNVISFMSAARILRGDSFYKQTRDRIKARNGTIFVATPSNDGPMAA